MAAELKDRAIKDELTGLYNRLGMVQLAQRELSKPVQERRALGVLMMDLDSFKLVNDRYGHACGDEVLRKFAAILNDSIRDRDIACRYGGDEFVALVWDVDSAGLRQVQQRIETAAGAWFADDERLQGLGVSIDCRVITARVFG
ncbi:MAG: GGDEF domain-containing protein [Candidatus Syntrophopropionicum ammoniitolerans]